MVINNEMNMDYPEMVKIIGNSSIHEPLNLNLATIENGPFVEDLPVENGDFQ